MGKVYLDKNVFDACVERINYVFDEFNHIFISLSGGKDSSVLSQIINLVAKERKRTFDIMFVDYEAQYQATIDHIYELKNLSNIDKFYHICWSMKASNNNSIFQRFWYPWNEDYKDIWVREMPEDSINIHNSIFGDYFEQGLFLRGIFKRFADWYKDYHKTDKIANFIGIRADESMNRFRAIAFGKEKYKDKKYSTHIGKGTYNFYPIYDWSTEDIWLSVHRYDFYYNQVYEMLWKSGLSIHEQRIAQPYGLRQKTSLDQWAKLEPETWHKIVNRVAGANFGNVYCKTSLLGHNGTEKPNHLSWQEYTVFLLESIGLYSPDLMQHYIRKIKIYFDHYKKERGVSIKDIPDEISKDEVIKEKGRENGRWIQWKRLAKCIEKNDFVMTGCNYGMTKDDKKDMTKLKEKWGKLLGIQTDTKPMRKLHEELFNEKTD